MKVISYYKELKQKYGNYWSENNIHVKIQQDLKLDRELIDNIIAKIA
jgi:hypothetical protein